MGHTGCLPCPILTWSPTVGVTSQGHCPRGDLTEARWHGAAPLVLRAMAGGPFAVAAGEDGNQDL